MTYKNGNTIVSIAEDGTKIRYVPDNQPAMPEFPESIDLKITNRCEMGCPMCHERSTPDGKHGNLDHPLLDTLRPYTELAIGGGNPLLHPDLDKFLARMASQKVICNITVHLHEFVNTYDMLRILSMCKLIHGIGVSIHRPPTEEEMKLLASLKNVVLHTIVGILDKTTYETLVNKHFNILLLGYKTFGRGIKYRSEFDVSIAQNTEWLKKQVKYMSKHFRAVCFDNLAIEQLEPKKQMTREAFKQMYMGNDGSFTMYVDLVENKFAASSTSSRMDINSNNIEELFKKDYLKQQTKE